MSDNKDRPGDVRLATTARRPDATLTYIGRVRTGNTDPDATPKNPARARERGDTATLEIDAPYRPGLEGLEAYSHVIVLCFLAAARRDLIQITRPGDSRPTGVFALRAPVRPNPISLSVVRLITVDAASGRVTTEGLDLHDGTPIVDLKPYRPGIDAIPHAVVP